jgi:hypothetical protein
MSIAAVVLYNTNVSLVPNGSQVDSIVDADPNFGFEFQESDIGSIVIVCSTTGQFLIGQILAVQQVAGISRASLAPQALSFQGVAILFRKV